MGDEDPLGQKDIDGEIKILIEKSCGCDGFDDIIRGKLNLSTREREGNLLRVNIEGDGLAKLVKNRMDTRVNLNSLVGLDGITLPDMVYAPFDLTLHSKVILYKSRLDMETPQSQTRTFASLISATDLTGIYIALPYTKITYDDLEGLQVPAAINYINYNAAPSFLNPPLSIYLNDSTTRTIDITYDFVGDVRESNTNPSPQNYDIKVFYGIGTNFYTPTTLGLIHNYGTFTTLGSSIPVIQAIDLQGTIPGVVIGPNESFWVWIELSDPGDYIRVNAPPNSITISINFDVASIQLTESTTTEETTTKAFAVFEALARVSASISGQVDSFRSEFFGRRNSEVAYDSNGCGSFAAITNGFQIRGFPIEDNYTDPAYPATPVLFESGRPVYTSMNELYDSLNAIHNLGLGVEQTNENTWAVVMEPKSYFYDPTVLLQISNIPNLKVSIANNYYYNKVTVGYEKWENEQINGLDEFNSKREYTLPIKNTDRQLTILSKLIASGYALEFTRRKRYTDSSSEDYKYDNDNFIISLNRTTDGAGNPSSLNVAEKNENFPLINNLISESTAYNLRLSPARNFLRWNPTINTGLLKKPGTSHKFTYGEANYKMESKISDACPGDYNDALLSESQDIQWDGENNNDSNPIWIPLYGEFEFPLTDQEWKVIKANPHGQLEISENSTDYLKTYILEIRRKQDGMASFKVIFANDEFTSECLMDYIDSEYIDCDYYE